MRARFINEFTAGTRVDAVFTVRAKEVRVARTGDTYLRLVLADRTGSLPAFMFEPPTASTLIPVGSVVRAVGRVTSYRDRSRIRLETLEPAVAYDAEELLAPGAAVAEELEERLYEYARLVEDSALRSALRKIFADKDFFGQFRSLPATVDSHHVTLHGLLEHTVEVAAISLAAAERYDHVNRDLLLSAALLHDIGVVDSLDVRGGVKDTDAGLLIGHEALGLLRVGDALDVTGGALSKQLAHAILTHHVYPAGPAPCTAEALILSNADKLDAQASAFLAGVAGATRLGERWTDEANPLHRSLMATSFPDVQEQASRSA